MGLFSNITDKLGPGSSVEDDLDQIQTQLRDLDLKGREADTASSFAKQKGFQDMAENYDEALEAVEDALAQDEADLRAFNQDSPTAASEAIENESTLMDYAREVDDARREGTNQVEKNYASLAKSINTGIEVMNQVSKENYSTVGEDVNWSDLDSQIAELDNAYDGLRIAEMELPTTVYAENPDQVQDKFEDILGDQVEGEVTYKDVETALGEAADATKTASSYLSEAETFENNCAEISGAIEETASYWSDAAEKLQ